MGKRQNRGNFAHFKQYLYRNGILRVQKGDTVDHIFLRSINKAMNGTVKTKTDRGFGFISRDGETKDLFFHSKDLNGVTFDEIQVGDKVTFEVEDGPKGPSAKNVQRVA